MALELDVPCVETSAQSGLHVEQAFVHVIEKIYQTSQLSKGKNAAAGPAGTATGAPAASGAANAAASTNNAAAATAPRRSSKVDLSGAGSNQPAAGKKSECCK